MRGILGVNALGRRLAAVLLGVTLLILLTGCSFIAGEFADDEVEEIPPALLAADIGVAEASTAKTHDGFTYYLSVWVDLDDGELTDAELGSILQIIVDENDLPFEWIKLSVDRADGEPIELEPIAERLVPGVVDTSNGNIGITMDGARQIIDAVNTGQ